MLVCTQASNNLIIRGTVFPGVSITWELRRVYTGFVISLNATVVPAPRKCLSQLRKIIMIQLICGYEVRFDSLHIVQIRCFGIEGEICQITSDVEQRVRSKTSQ